VPYDPSCTCMVLPVVLPVCEPENIWKHGLVSMFVECLFAELDLRRSAVSWSSQKASLQHQGRRGY
jgi:hypothetical protein